MKNETKTTTSSTEMVTISRAEYERFQAQGERISALEKQVEQLMEAIRLSRKKQFGSSSEKLGEDAYEQLSLLFNEAEAYLPASEKNETTTVCPYPAEAFLPSGGGFTGGCAGGGGGTPDERRGIGVSLLWG